MNVEPGAKFAAFFLSRCGVKADLPQEEQIEPGVWMSQKFGVEVAEHWREWLGSLATDEMKEGGLAVYVTAPSRDPEVLNAENQALVQQVNDVLNGLLLQGVPEFMRGVLVNGANVDGQIGIRQHSSFRELYVTSDQSDFLVGAAEIRQAVWLGQRLRVLQDARKPEWGRLIRGVRTVLSANHLKNEVGDRLHQFVRALEAVIKPRIGESRNNFGHRGQTIAPNNAITRDALLQLFDLRSAVEHLNVPTDALPPGGTEEERRELVNRRTRQADALARFALLGILKSPAMFDTFRTDEGIDAFWELDYAARIARWGNRLDVVAIP